MAERPIGPIPANERARRCIEVPDFGHAISYSQGCQQPKIPAFNMEKPSENTIDSAPKPANGAERPALTNPSLGAALTADYEALRNDMAQAAELAAEFQRRLSEKSNETALLKQVFEKTRTDLGKMQTDILELRRERHRLANEAMRAQAFEMMLKQMTSERDRLSAELETMRADLAAARQEIAARHEPAERAEKPNGVVARLTARVESLNAQLAAAPARASVDPELRAVAGTISEAVQRLMGMIDPRPVVVRPPALNGNSQIPDEDHIDISFGV